MSGLRWLFLATMLFAPATPANTPPEAPRPTARAWLLVDHDSGRVLTEHGADQPLAPASLTKLITSYLVFEALQQGKLKLDDRVTVSRHAAAHSGASLFLRPGEVVSVEDLIRGMIVSSANDATVALAERIAGSDSAFIERMNTRARELGLEQTRFANVTGLDQDGQRSTARELTRLAGYLIRDFPQQYQTYFRLREFTHNRIRQYNRNALLWRDATVDGVKTGRTRAAGHNLIASARRGSMRLLATVLGAPNEGARVDGAQRLLEHGFRHFETRLLYAADTPAARLRVWMGNQSELPIGVGRPLYLTLARGQHEKLNARLTTFKTMQTAPVLRGERLGTLALEVEGKPYAEYPLVALQEVTPGNVVQRFIDRIQLWLR
ncbi:MAG: D-alanyl-D-alanine carboxypeptidase family protein [Pseudomonadota bacterium]